MSFFPTPEPIKWGPALRYYGLLLGLVAGASAICHWQHWLPLPAWGQACLVLVVLIVSFWPILRMSAKDPGE